MKLFNTLLCSSLLLSGAGIPVAAQEFEQAAQSDSTIIHWGKIGTAVWTIDSNGLLTIGEGEYDHSEWKGYPWKDYLSEVKRVDGTASFKLIGIAEDIFSNNNTITSIDLSGWDVTEVTTMRSMFRDCRDLTSLNLSGWTTPSVTTMFEMFSECSSLTSLDLSGWDTSSVTDMSCMF